MSVILKQLAQPVLQTVVARNVVACGSARHFLWFGTKKDVRFPKDLDHTTGEERAVQMAIAKGNPDPFDLKEMIRGPGTKESPNVVKTFDGKRLIGCKCEEDSASIKYMWVHLEEPKRCDCGFWFKAVEAPKFWEEVDK